MEIARILGSSPELDEVYKVVGPHLRHCTDHFQSLLNGIEHGRVDYDDRERNVRIETEPAAAVELLEQLMLGIEKLAERDPWESINVMQMGSHDSQPLNMPSSLDRELVFLSSHTIHHLALMIELSRQKGVELPREFGVAFSTARYLQQKAGTA